MAFVFAVFGGLIAGSLFAYHVLHITSSRVAVVGYVTSLTSVLALGAAAKLAEKTLIVSTEGVEMRSRSGVIAQVPLASVAGVEWQRDRGREHIAILSIAHTNGVLRFRAKGREVASLEACFRFLGDAIGSKSPDAPAAGR